MLRLLAMQHPALSGLPMAILADIARLIKGVRDSLFRQSCVPQVPNAHHAPKGVSQRAGGDAVIERAKI